MCYNSGVFYYIPLCDDIDDYYLLYDFDVFV